MNFWWVNQNQTFKHEFEGGYLWSPKINRDASRNPFYDFMKGVCPGDIVFSFSDTLIQGFGIAQSHCYTSPQPDEFGHIGKIWNAIGWRVDVNFRPFNHKTRPKDHMSVLKSVLPDIYAPLQANGNGNQGVYLTKLSKVFAQVLTGLIGPEAQPLIQGTAQEEPDKIFETELKGITEWEDIEVEKILESSVSETEQFALVKARIGQGLFKKNIFHSEKQCRITHVRNPVHLIASHIKPWREASNHERLHEANGLLLTPSIDHLFDRGFISFDDSGETLISPVADPDALQKMGVNVKEPPKVGSFNIDQKHFLGHHRRFVFLDK